MKPLTKSLRCKEIPQINLAMVKKAKRLCMVKKLLFVIFVERRIKRLISARTSLKRVTYERVRLVLTSTPKLRRKKDPKRFRHLRVK